MLQEELAPLAAQISMADVETRKQERERIASDEAAYADAIDHLVRLLERQVTGPNGWPKRLRFPEPRTLIERKAFEDFHARLEHEIGHPVRCSLR